MRIVCYRCREEKAELRIIGFRRVPEKPADAEVDGLCPEHSVLFVAEARVWLAQLGALRPLEATRGAPEPPASRVQRDAA